MDYSTTDQTKEMFIHKGEVNTLDTDQVCGTSVFAPALRTGGNLWDVTFIYSVSSQVKKNLAEANKKLVSAGGFRARSVSEVLMFSVRVQDMPGIINFP